MTVREKALSLRREVSLITLLGTKRKVQAYWDAVQASKRPCICAEEANIPAPPPVSFLESQEEYKEPVTTATMMLLVIERFVKNAMGLPSQLSTWIDKMPDSRADHSWKPCFFFGARRTRSGYSS